MNTCRLRTMWLPMLVGQFGLILRSEAQTPSPFCNMHSTFRPPVNSDITVTCGTEVMELSILLCPVYFGGYNETLMALNAQFILPECHGIPDWNVDPPILKFSLSITADAVAVCSNTFRITNEVGTGIFSDFSNVQFVNISGIINSLDPSAAIVTYRQQIMYVFSCRYPLQYLINNSKVAVSGVSLAVRDDNGSFFSTLSMWLYSDTDYTQQLIVPENGIHLKTRIFVGVKAINLTERFHILLDRCYATTSPVPNNSTYYDLFVGCARDGQTRVELNGVSQNAHFSFEAFRFIEHKNMTVSTFYLHCVTRLCEVASCSSLLPNCSGSSRRNRETQGVLANDQATISSGPIKTKVDDGAAILYHWTSGLPTASQFASKSQRSPMGHVAVSTAVLIVICLSMALFIGLFLRRRRLSIFQ